MGAVRCRICKVVPSRFCPAPGDPGKGCPFGLVPAGEGPGWSWSWPASDTVRGRKPPFCCRTPLRGQGCSLPQRNLSKSWLMPKNVTRKAQTRESWCNGMRLLKLKCLLGKESNSPQPFTPNKRVSGQKPNIDHGFLMSDISVWGELTQSTREMTNPPVPREVCTYIC